ncbi:MAG TPA: MBL fold metallo-hydrolase [bacterium]|nr:MBL fold metallo-hydrolase [bacterium]
MEIKIIFDKAAVNSKMKIGWGLSILTGGGILFDTGEKGEWLLENFEQMGIDVKKDIKNVVISHDHWDHTGGLCDILRSSGRENMPVYVCPGFSMETMEKINKSGGRPVVSECFMQITDNVYTTGEIPGNYKGKFMPEQALVLKTDNGISVITGCAHPGILRILEAVKKHFKKDRLFSVIGGFHLIDEDKRIIRFIAREFKNMGVLKAAPTHCSGPYAEEIFSEEYGKNFIAVKAGKTLKL